MKYFETKHEINSAKITTLIVVIIVLLCFVVGQNYQDPPEEYGVAINFGSSSVVDENINSNPPEKLQESEPEPEETTPEDIVEEETIEEEIEEEEVEEETIEEIEKALEEAKAEEAAKAEAEAAEAEKLLQQEREEALRIKKEKEAQEAKEAKEKLEKEQKEAAAKAKKEAQEKAEAKRKAQKLAAEKKARALEAKKKAEKAASDARKAEAARIAKAKAQAAAKKAAADAAAAAAAKEKGSGNQTVSFALIENVPVYPGCEGGNNAAKKKCMNDKIKQFLGQNFNKSLASDLDLQGIQKVNIFFKIDKTGRVVGIRAKAPHPKLEDEAKRVTKLLPKMKPGMQQGKPTTVSFYLPLNVKAN